MTTSLDGTVDLQGHRGARGKRPENTIPAFQYCLENHMTTIELDTNLTKDHQLIICHDTVLNSRVCRYENGRPIARIPVRELTVAELKQLDCGGVNHEKFSEQIPVRGTRLITLNELFEFVRKFEQNQAGVTPIRFNIETKFGKACTRSEIHMVSRLVVNAIADAGMAERSAVQSFVLEILPEVKRLDGRIRTSALFEPGFCQSLALRSPIFRNREKILQKALSAGADIISPHFLYVDSKFIQRCHGCGKKVIPWVLNDERLIRGFLEWGVDGIISDYPDRLYRVYAQWVKDRSPDNSPQNLSCQNFFL